MQLVFLLTSLLAFQLAAAAKVFYPVQFVSLGCWNDSRERAIPTAEGHPLLRDPCHKRPSPAHKCARVAHLLGYHVFAVQDGGWCYTSKNAIMTYRKYGTSQRCRDDGEGGPLANQVYQITSAAKVKTCDFGCWRDFPGRAIPSLEKLDPQLMGNPRDRVDPLGFCVGVAVKRGYRVIAMQEGGMCMGARDAMKTYTKYGKSIDCPADGLGGKFANNVYYLQYEWIKYEN